MIRAALFAGVGVLFFVLWLLFKPTHGISASQTDWNLVLGFSAALAGLAVALPLFARLAAGRRATRVSLIPAAGAAVGSVANVVEDGFAVEEAFFGFVAGSALLVAGLAALSVAVALGRRGVARLIAFVPAATLAGIVAYVEVGGVLLLAAWLVAAGYAMRTAAPDPRPQA